MTHDAVRWMVVALAALGLVLLLAFARDDPGVGGALPRSRGCRASSVIKT